MLTRLVAIYQTAEPFDIAVIVIGGMFVLLVAGAKAIGWIAGPEAWPSGSDEQR